MLVYNLANMLTLSRLAMSVVFFVLVSFRSIWAVPVLMLAGITDILDGWVARKYEQQSDFGRIADPAMDKVLICCGFILLCGKSEETFVAPWMAAVIVGRELVVTALRSLVESRGKEFAATFWGKSKMFVQFITLTYLILMITSGDLLDLSHGSFESVAHVLVWLTVVVTAMSGLVYILQANTLVRGSRDA